MQFARLCGASVRISTFLALCVAGLHARAVDFESFEFNDPLFTPLTTAVNTANPGNFWFNDQNDPVLALFDSEVESGVFRIDEFSDDFKAAYLQIDNITPDTTGSRFLVVEFAGWNILNPFEGFDACNPEQVRFGFLNDDTGTSGSSVAAQVQIRRNTSTEQMELVGDALGLGSSSLPTIVPLGVTQSAPFTMVLEFDKLSSTYEVFFKDGNQPSQSLGIGAIAPGRNGNSIRMVINNNFGSDFDEFVAIDRIALTDVNPLTDLMTLEIDRTSGQMTLINTTGSTLAGLTGYSLRSSVGALDPVAWVPITGNYDNASGPGNGLVDPDGDWALSTATNQLLSEAAVGGNGGTLTLNQEVLLSTVGGAWLQNPNEDVTMELRFTGGVVRRANVNFVGNGGAGFQTGDLNFDGQLTAADWSVFIAGAEAELANLSAAEAYQSGDLDGDGVNSILDFGIFKEAFEAANGAGSFAAMLAVPEPAAGFLVLWGLLSLASRAGGRRC